MMELELFSLLEYWVGTCWMGDNKVRSKKYAISTKPLLWKEWKGYEESQLLSLILKLPAIIKTFWIFASVFLKYFKAEWLLSE